MTYSSQGPLWASAAMRDLDADIACAVRSDARVMITGESGVGKKFVAQLIHRRSHRGSAPLVIANCLEFLESIFQSSVLRHAQFASESADRPTHGLLKTACGGSLLLEKVEKIPPAMQSQLLQFIESDTTPLRAGQPSGNGSDVRLMTATTTDLLHRVQSKRLLEDLFYRLNVIHLIIPTLRDRPEDIPILLRHYLSFYRRAEVPRLSTAAWQRLVEYPWPGNVQELKAVAEKLAVRDLPPPIEPHDLPPEIGQ